MSNKYVIFFCCVSTTILTALKYLLDLADIMI